jgi:hypothetical protein
MENTRWFISLIMSGLITGGGVYLQAVYPMTFSFVLYFGFVSVMIYFLTEVIYSELGRYNIFARREND